MARPRWARRVLSFYKPWDCACKRTPERVIRASADEVGLVPFVVCTGCGALSATIAPSAIPEQYHDRIPKYEKEEFGEPPPRPEWGTDGQAEEEASEVDHLEAAR